MRRLADLDQQLAAERLHLRNVLGAVVVGLRLRRARAGAAEGEAGGGGGGGGGGGAAEQQPESCFKPAALDPQAIELVDAEKKADAEA